MRAALIALSLALLVVVVAGSGTVELGERKDGDIKKWSDVMGKKKPTLVFFFDPDCGHCRGFMPEFEAAAEEFGSGVTFAKINVVRWDELKAKYDVHRVPDIRFCPVGHGEDCTPYPEYSPNTKAGVLEFLGGRADARFAQADADADTQAASLTEAEMAAVLATKGTCEVPPHAPAHAEADADAVLGEDEDTGAEAEAETADESFENEDEAIAEAFVEIEDEAEAEVEAEVNAEDEDEEETEEEDEAEAEDEEEAEAEDEEEAGAESEQEDS